MPLPRARLKQAFEIRIPPQSSNARSQIQFRLGVRLLRAKSQSCASGFVDPPPVTSPGPHTISMEAATSAERHTRSWAAAVSAEHPLRPLCIRLRSAQLNNSLISDCDQGLLELGANSTENPIDKHLIEVFHARSV